MLSMVAEVSKCMPLSCSPNKMSQNSMQVIIKKSKIEQFTHDVRADGTTVQRDAAYISGSFDVNAISLRNKTSRNSVRVRIKKSKYQ